MQNLLSRYDIPRAFLIVLGLSLAYLGVLIYFTEGVIDQGDGLGHHHIARFSWQHRWLMLDHWGKPMYTLLSSPFAQFGIKGSAVFNVLVFAATALMLLRIVQHFRMTGSWLIPLLLLASPEYMNNVLAGLTETLFGAMVVAVLWQLLKQNWKTAAVIASFIPFARSEGMLIVVLLLPLLLWLRQWKAVPLLFAGFILYGLAGVVVFHDFLWYFHNDPYKGFGSVYGHGEWYHFIIGSITIFGAPLLVLFLLGSFYFFDRVLRGRPGNWLILLFAFGVFAGVYATHSYLWSEGKKGSLGLLRVIICVFPLVIPVAIYGLSKINLHSKWVRGVAITAVLGVALCMPYRYFEIPSKMTVQEKLYGGAGTWLKNYLAAPRLLPKTIAVHNPMISEYAGFDLFDKARFPNFWQVKAPYPELSNDDLFVWDAQFGAVEGGLEYDTIAHNGFNLLRRFHAGTATTNMRGMPHEARVYTRHPLKADTVLVKEIVYNTRSVNSTKSPFDVLPEMPRTWFGNDTESEHWIDYEIIAEATPETVIENMHFVVCSKNMMHYNAARIPVLPGQAAATFTGRIYLPQFEAAQFPYINQLWLQGNGNLRFQQVKIRIMKRVVTLL